MTRRAVLQLSIYGLLGIAGPAQAAPAVDYDQLIRAQDYLAATAALAQDTSLAGTDRNYVEGVLANRSGDVARSEALLAPLRQAAALNGERAQTALLTLADDATKQGAYGRALDAYQDVLQHFAESLPPRVRRQAEENAGLLKLLRDVPPPSVALAGPGSVPTDRNALGLPEIPVRVANKNVSWVVDTAANHSGITRSGAEELGLKLLPGSALTQGPGGGDVAVNVAVLPQLRIGTAVLQNVIVLVFNDKDLHIGGSSFLPWQGTQISGIVGFPELAALKRLTFGKDTLTFNGPPQPGGSRLFMAGITPVIAASTGGATHLYSLDNRAAATMLTQRYAAAYPASLADAPTETVELPSAGGAAASIKAYTHVLVGFAVGGGDALLEGAMVAQEPLPTGANDFYGNFGRDLLGQFSRYTIDFEHMVFSANK